MIPTILQERILLAVIGLAAVCSTVQVQGLTWEQTAWRSALYYRTTFEAPEAGEGLLHIAAADSFAAYFNGELVGSDSSVVQPRVFAVPVVRGDNHIAALVVNRGRGRGNGLAATLAVEFAAGDTSIVQTTIDRTRQPWYWSAQLQADDGWTTAAVAQDEAWHLVQEGTLEPALSSGQPIAGFLGGTDIGSLAGGIILKQVRGQNLAKDRISNRPEVLDGDLNTSWNPPINALNFNADIDLGTRRKIHAVRVLDPGPQPRAVLRPFPARLLHSGQRRPNPLDRSGHPARHCRFHPHRGRFSILCGRAICAWLSSISMPSPSQTWPK